MQRVAIVGHSYVKHLREFVRDDIFTDDAFGLDNAEIQFFGVSGLTVRKLRLVEHRVRRFKPTTVVLILGDNDIENGVDPEILTLRLVAAVAMLQKWAGMAKVIKLDVVPRFWVPTYKYFCPNYEQVALALNTGFRDQVEEMEGIFAWSCRGLSFHDARGVNWGSDGVHLRIPGNSLLYQGIKKALQVFKNL